MSDRRKRRRWSAAEKLEICGQARVPGVSVAQVARRYALNANMLHAWLRDPRFAGDDEAIVDVSSASEEVVAQPPFYEVSVSSDPAPARVGRSGSQGSVHASRVDLYLSDGRRILIEGAMSLAAIVALVEGLAD